MLGGNCPDTRRSLALLLLPAHCRGQATTLKRNGSDFSATIMGSLLRSSHITIWTDVDGVYSADPRKVRPAGQLQGGATRPHLSPDKQLQGRHV